MSNKTLIFLPDTSTYPYLRTLLLTASANSESGNILVTQCTGQMKYCSPVNWSGDSTNISSERKEKLCKNCSKLCSEAQKQYNFKLVKFNDFITESEYKKLESLIPCNINECVDFIYENVQMGYIASHSFTLNTKIYDFSNLSDKNLKVFQAILFDCLYSYYVSKKIKEKLNPDLTIVFNPYSWNVACKLAMKNFAFKYITVGAYLGDGFDQLYITDNQFNFFENTCQKWSKYKTLPLNYNCMKSSWNDTFFRLFNKGFHVFSSSKECTPLELSKSLNLDDNKKTVVVFTSSYDETVNLPKLQTALNFDTGRENLFSTTVDWLKELKTYSEQKKDIQFIVRIHPREGKICSGFDSPHLAILQNEFKENTDNFKIIWANDETSSYDLMELADLCLISESSMGYEAARLGIPVITYVKNSYYVDSSFSRVPESKDEYFKCIEEFLNKDVSYEMLRDACRYSYWRTFIGVVDMSSCVKKEINDTTYWPKLDSNLQRTVRDILNNKIDVIDYNLGKINKNLNNLDDEKKAIKDGILEYLYRVSFSDYMNLKFTNFILRCFNKILVTLSRNKLHFDINSVIDKIKDNKDKELINKCNIKLLEENYYLITCGKLNDKRFSPVNYRLAKIYFEI